MKKRLRNRWNQLKDIAVKQYAEWTRNPASCARGRDDLDQKLKAYLPERGVYVEAGALDGFYFSNTYYLDRVAGWTGLLVEPNPPEFHACSRFRRRARTVNCALVAFDFPDPTVTLNYGADLTWVEGSYNAEELEDRHSLISRFGRSGEKITVPARTLQSLLDENDLKVDFLSLDVEGYESSVLRGLDLDRSAPGAILVECSTDARLRETETILAMHYQKPLLLTHHDYLFLLKS